MNNPEVLRHHFASDPGSNHWDSYGSSRLNQNFQGLEKGYQRYSSFFNYLPMPSIMINPLSYKVEEANDSFCMLIRTSREYLLHKNLSEVLAKESVLELMDNLDASKLPAAGLLRLKNQKNYKFTCFMDKGIDVNAPFFLSLWEAESQDGWERKYSEMNTILENKVHERTKALEKVNHELLKLSSYDQLTNLPNKKLFKDHLRIQIARCLRSQEKFSIMVVNLVDFRNVNDKFGHLFGDSLLIRVADKLKSLCRKGDIIARVQSDEFIILLNQVPDTSILYNIGQKIISAFRNPMVVDYREVKCKVNIGASIFPKDSENPDELIKFAGLAAQSGKAKGGSSLKIFDLEIKNQILKQREFEEDLSDALILREYFLTYQPKVDSNKEVVGVEALLRWRSEKRGVVPPNLFIPVLENNREIIAVGYWVIQEVCRQIKEWQEEKRAPFKVAINLSPYQFQDNQLIPKVQEIINKFEINPQLIEFEITESGTMFDIQASIDKMHQLRNMGVALSLDDFGTGYSSFNYLIKFPINTLKIDKSFIDNVLINLESATTTKSIIHLAKDLGLNVIAEGVETQDQFNFLVDNGCDQVQGYLISKPLESKQLSSNFVAKESNIE